MVETTPGKTVFLSGAVPPELLDHASRSELGVLVQPGTARYARHADAFGSWAVDNGCFAQGDAFDSAAWFSWVQELDRSALFVVAPDVVGDAAATWRRSAPWLDKIRGAGHKAAFVFQDGVEHNWTRWSSFWDSFDAAFIGGTDEWKLAHPGRRGSALSPVVFDLVAEANERGKHTHVGRVNSGARYSSCCEAGADTADGTFLARAGAREGIPRMLRWFDRPVQTYVPVPTRVHVPTSFAVASSVEVGQ